MNKPQSLRNAVPYVAENPDRLHLFVDNGAEVAISAKSISWEYHYTLNVIVMDFTGDQNLLMAPVLFWLGVNQLDAMQHSTERERLFEADILGNDSCDINMNLTELVILKEVDGVM